MTFGVLIDIFVNEKGTTVKVYEYLRFIDSFKMMNSSLEKLEEVFPENQFEIMKSLIPTVSDENIQLLKQKGYYPYSNMSSRTKFSDTQLLPLEKWGNTLDGGNVKIIDSNLAHANRLWEIFCSRTLQDYHDAYLIIDCWLLTWFCEFHRELSFTTYKLDCMHFFTLLKMAREASLRIFKANVEILTEGEHLDMIEPAFRGGVTSVYKNRRLIAINQYIPNYNGTEDHQFGFCVDANNLYAGVMQLEQLPLSEFVFNTEVTIKRS